MATRQEQMKALREKQRKNLMDSPVDTGGFGNDNVWASMAPKYRDPNRKIGALAHRVRILPSYKIFLLGEEPTEDNIKFWFPLHYHGKALSNMERKILCPKHSKIGHGTCPICDIQAKADMSRNPAERQFANKIKARPKFYVNMYFPDDLDAGIKVWGIPPTAFDPILYSFHVPDEYPDVDDVSATGVDLLVTVKENAGGYWEYTINAAHTPTPVTMPEWETKLINLEDLLLRNIPSADQLTRIAMGEPSKDVFARAKVTISEEQASSISQTYAADIMAAPIVPQTPGSAVANAIAEDQEPASTPPPRRKRRKVTI